MVNNFHSFNKKLLIAIFLDHAFIYFIKVIIYDSTLEISSKVNFDFIYNSIKKDFYVIINLKQHYSDVDSNF